MLPNLSLRGKLVVITRSVEGSKPWITYLKKQGAIPYSFPTIKIVPSELTPKIANILKHISDFDWIVFTSAAGVRSFKELANKTEVGKLSTKIAVIGDATARAARAIGYHVAFQPSSSNGAALGYELESVLNRSILLLRTSIASRELSEILIVRGGNVTELPIYKTVLRHDPDPKFLKLLETNRIDLLMFASPSAVHGFFQRVPKKLHKKALELSAVAIGPSIVPSLKKAGFKDISGTIRIG